MRRVAIALGLVSCAHAPAMERRAAAEFLFVGGVVATMRDGPRAEALATRGERIVFVGSRADGERLVGPRTRVIELAGGMLLPGFHDSHVHPVTGQLARAGCALDGLATQQAIVAQVAACAKARPDAAWVVGRGWPGAMFPDANPRREWLDAVVPDRPAMMISIDGHSTWANSRALALGGITSKTPDPPMGRIERDADGSPSGTLRNAAAGLVRRKAPAPTTVEQARAAKRALAAANAEGITSLVDASVDEALLRTYSTLDAVGELTATVTATLWVNPQRDGEAERLARLRPLGTAHVRATAAKIFADGVLMGRTAAMLSPYPDGTQGSLLEPSRLARLVLELEDAGFQIHVHAVGDAAVRATLDAFQAARGAHGDKDLRHGIAHIGFAAPEDLLRLRALSVVAVMQPIAGCANPRERARLAAMVGEERVARRFPLASLARAGAIVAGGSDWPVLSLRPLDAIEVAVTRRPLGRSGVAPLGAEEALDLEAALRAYTLGGAWFAHDDRDSGTLEAGKRADLVVLDRDLARVRPEAIHEAQVVRTFVRGREVFTRAAGTAPVHQAPAANDEPTPP